MDEVAQRLEALHDALVGDLAGVSRVVRHGEGVDVLPDRPGALAFCWVDFGDSLQVETLGGQGGRWELDRTLEDVGVVEEVARAVLEGRVTETFAPGRSVVRVTRPDGTQLSETGYQAAVGCLPLPAWPRWSRTVRYPPYRESLLPDCVACILPSHPSEGARVAAGRRARP